MIWKSRRRLVVFIVVVLIGTIGSTLGIIYFTTYMGEKRKNVEILTMFAESYETKGMPKESIKEEPPQPKPDLEISNADMPQPMEDEKPEDMPILESGKKEDHRYEVSTFYAVAFQADGTVTDYLNDETSGLSDEELIETAVTLKESHKKYGQGKGFVFLITEWEDSYLVSMMDTSVLDDTISALFRYMILFGCIAISVLTILTVFLSRWIMKPATTAYEKQKRFISDAGHELKTPIATICANAELLCQEISDNKWLENIIYENNRMSLIVHELLDIARMEQVKPVMETLDFSTICMSAVMPFEAAAFEHGVGLDYEIAEQISITGNKADLEKMVGILVDNAISHCTIPGSISITLKMEREKAILLVSNTGNKLSEEECSNMFERFYRNDCARSDQNGHYGLGLSIAKTIVETHEGRIKANWKDGRITLEVVIPGHVGR